MFCECCGRNDCENVVWNEETEEYMCKTCLAAFKAEMGLDSCEVIQ